MRLGVLLRWLVIGSLFAAVALWLAGAGFSGLALSAANLSQSAWVVFGLGLLALPCGISFDRGRQRPLMAAGSIVAGLAAAGWIYLLWNVRILAESEIEMLARINGTMVTAAALVSMVAVLIMHRTLNPVAVMLRRVTYTIGTMFALVVVFAAWFAEHSRYEEEIAKAIGVLGILTACGVLVTFLLIRLRQLELEGEDDEAARGEDEIRLDLNVRCPRCGCRQAMQTGGADCGQCGLRIRIAVP